MGISEGSGGGGGGAGVGLLTGRGGGGGGGGGGTSSSVVPFSGLVAGPSADSSNSTEPSSLGAILLLPRRSVVSLPRAL